MRKIIQIQTNYTGIYTQFTALCDDGTVWFKTSFDAEWKQLNTILQPEKPESNSDTAKPNVLNTYDGFKSKLGSTYNKVQARTLYSDTQFTSAILNHPAFKINYAYICKVNTLMGYYTRYVISTCQLQKDMLNAMLDKSIPAALTDIEYTELRVS